MRHPQTLGMQTRVKSLRPSYTGLYPETDSHTSNRHQVPEWKLNGTAKPEVALDTLSLETLREICRDLEMDYPADKAAAVAAISQSSGLDTTPYRMTGVTLHSHVH